MKAAVEKANWQARPSPQRDRSGDLLKGRGIAYAQRGGTVVALVAEIEVQRKSGRNWARKLTLVHDCGLIVNPAGLRLTIRGALTQALSRALFEEVRFDRNRVTSVDWASYPIWKSGMPPRR